MMKWGRKKPSSSSSHHHFISHVFPLSWFSKFKQSSEKPTSGIIQKGNKNFERANLKSPKCCSSSNRDSRFYTQDDDGFWRFSFGEEGDKNSKKTVIKKGKQSKEATVRDEGLSRTYRRIIKATSELERELGEVKEGYRKSVEKEIPEEIDLLHVMQMMRMANSRKTERLHKQKDEKQGIPEEIDMLQANSRETERFHQQSHVKQGIPEEIELLQVMQIIGRDNSRETERFHQQKHEKQGIPEEIDLLQANSRKTERFHQQKHEKQGISQWEQTKDAKIKELKSKNEKQRNSFHIGLKQSKVRVRSPRASSKTDTCKIQAIENLKKAKMKKKMKEMTTMEEKAAAMESFAVVKCSRDPNQDFRESMIEMIVEKRIRRPEELEELLACYLTLNADEYHGLIIKVFRQVWCELEEAYFDQKSPKEGYYDV